MFSSSKTSSSSSVGVGVASITRRNRRSRFPGVLIRRRAAHFILPSLSSSARLLLQLLLFAFFAAFSSPFSRPYNTNREEQKKRRNLNEEQRTRDEFLFFSITQHSRQLIKRDDLIKTDDGTKAQRICFYHHPQSVRIKRVSKEQTRSLLLTLRLRRNGDFANADLFPYLLGVKSVDRGVGGNASRTRQQKAQNNTKNNAHNNNTTSRQFLSL